MRCENFLLTREMLEMLKTKHLPMESLAIVTKHSAAS
jgi:hypothetical protein